MHDTARVGLSGAGSTGAGRFALAWTEAVAGLGYVPMSRTETEHLLLDLTQRLMAAVTRDPFSDRPGQEVGAALVAAHFTEPDMLAATVRTVGARLVECLEPADVAGIDAPTAATRVVHLQSALAAGYTRALRSRTLAEQERVSEALWRSRAEADHALRESEARFRAVFAGSAIGIGIADTQGRILQVNQAFARILGYTVEEFCRLNVTDLALPEDGTAMWELYGELMRGERDHIRLDKRYIRKDGGVVWTDLAVSLIRDCEDRPKYTVAMVEDITDRHELEERLRFQALHDPLTGLPNRTLLFDRLADVFAHADPGARVGVCYLDLDGFKVVNDSLGHQLGDRLLLAVARRLDSWLRPHGYLLARMGGDEFVVLVEHSNGTDEATAVADAVLRALVDPVHVEGHELGVSASIGVVERPIAGTTPVELMQAADLTLYRAKADGKNRWALFDPAHNSSESSGYLLATSMPAALQRGEFHVAYQPLVGLRDGALHGVEALVRWRHPQLGELRPDQFIGLAEETGMIVPLGRWVLAQACRQARAWLDAFPETALVMSVNVAVPQVRDPGFVDDVRRVLADNGLAAGVLQLELTESILMSPNGQPLEVLQALADMGVSIAIDDFGTGYSNLAYLRNLPVHTLKLAGPFIDGLRHLHGGSSVDEQIVDTLIRLAHALGLSVTAEAVETATQADRLGALGCDVGQGWYLAPPVSADQISAFLARQGTPG